MHDSRGRAGGARRRRDVARATDAPAQAATAPDASATDGPATDDRAVATPVVRAADGPRVAVPLGERIRVRAYELYLARGDAPGSDVDDWLAAERALLGDDGHDGVPDDAPVNGHDGADQATLHHER